MLIQLRMGAYSVEDGRLFSRGWVLIQLRMGTYSVEAGRLFS